MDRDCQGRKEQVSQHHRRGDQTQVKGEAEEGEEGKTVKTLEELLAERRKIDEQIHALKYRTAIHGRAKLGFDHYPARPDEWYISIQRILDIEPCKTDMKRYSIIRSTDREKCIGYIDEIIKDLQGLKQAIADKEGGEDGD